MSHTFSLQWTSFEASASPTPVRADKLANSDLIRRAQEGVNPDRAAFGELMKRYQSHVDRVLYHLAPDWQDRADLAQEVWIRVYRNIRSVQEPEKFRGWLSRIATNLFYDELRKRKRAGKTVSLDATRSMEDSEMSWELPADDPSPSDRLATKEFYEQLQVAIKDLPDAFRQTIVLREINGLSYEEIAEITQVSIGTVKSRIARARTKLQQHLTPYLEG
jgi:RNA polymerase sigma factor (sigma-70 family)